MSQSESLSKLPTNWPRLVKMQTSSHPLHSLLGCLESCTSVGHSATLHYHASYCLSCNALETYIPFCGFYVHILGAASHKSDNSQKHGNCRDGKSDGPANTFLDVDKGCDGQERAQVDGKVEPVKEAVFLLAVLQAPD